LRRICAKTASHDKKRKRAGLAATLRALRVGYYGLLLKASYLPEVPLKSASPLK